MGVTLSRRPPRGCPRVLSYLAGEAGAFFRFGEAWGVVMGVPVGVEEMETDLVGVARGVLSMESYVFGLRCPG